MRILYLTEAMPFPLTTGYLRHYFFLRELAPRHCVTLLSLVDDKFREEHLEALRPFTENIVTFRSKDAGRGSDAVVCRVGRILRRLVLPGADLRQMRSVVSEQVRTGSFDAAVFSGKATFPLVSCLGRLPMLVDLCDATSARLRAMLRAGQEGRRASLWLDYLRVRHIERRLIRRASHVLFASSRDLRALMAGQPQRASVVPNGVDLDYWKRSARDLGSKTVVFTGAMDYPPNLDAALCLIREILPQVRHAIPDVKTWIVGRDPPEALLRAGQQAGVTVTGFVEDVRPYLEQAAVFAAPLRFGAGIQNKVLEAMAMEVPVVASPLAADGLRPGDGVVPPLCVAEGADAFARCLVEQLTRREDCPAADTQARQFVAQHFTWNRAGEKLDELLREIVPTGGSAQLAAKTAASAYCVSGK